MAPIFGGYPQLLTIINHLSHPPGDVTAGTRSQPDDGGGLGDGDDQYLHPVQFSERTENKERNEDGHELEPGYEQQDVGGKTGPEL